MELRQSECHFDGDGWRFDSDGTLNASIYITRPGVFPTWDDKNGRFVRELRGRDEVHKQGYLDGFLGRPLTNNHPVDKKTGKQRLVTLDTIKGDITGTIYGPHEVAPDGLHTKANVRVFDSATIQDIMSGKRKVSAGFLSEVLDEAGVDPEFGEYDRKLINLQANHVSVVWAPRVGPGAEITADEANMQEIEIEISEESPEEETLIETADKKPKKKKGVPQMDALTKVTLDGAEFDLPEAAASAVAKLQTANEALQAKYDALAEIDVNQLVAERVSLLDKARKLNPEAKYDGLDNVEIMRAALAKDFEGKSNDYVAARFDAALEVAETASPVPSLLARLDSADPVDADPIEAARQKQISEYHKGI